MLNPTHYRTRRLLLRPVSLTDAASIQRLAGDRAIADTTANIPHPYTDGLAEKWVESQQKRFAAGELVNFAIALNETDELIGVIGLMNISAVHRRAELGYWVGLPYWNQGYATEAAQQVIEHGFLVLGLNRVHGNVLKRNPASRRVFEKIGMTYEGCLRAHEKKWDEFEDILVYGLLRDAWDALRSSR